MWEIVSQKIPFADLQPWEIVNIVVNGQRPLSPIECPLPVVDLIEQCWMHKSTFRPSMTNVVNQCNSMLKELQFCIDNVPQKTNNNNDDNDNVVVDDGDDDMNSCNSESSDNDNSTIVVNNINNTSCRARHIVHCINKRSTMASTWAGGFSWSIDKDSFIANQQQQQFASTDITSSTTTTTTSSNSIMPHHRRRRKTNKDDRKVYNYFSHKTFFSSFFV